MEPISKSVVRKDHAPKITGTSIYVDDYANTGVLTGRFLRSKTARARIVSVTVPELPPGYFYVDKDDVPGVNKVHIVMDDTPVFAQDTVEYIGEPIAMVVGPDVRQVEAIIAGIRVEYEELEPVLDLRRADTVFFDYEYGRGDLEKAFAEADQVFTEEFSTGYQDQTYLETQGMMAEPEPDGRLFVHGSLQCVYYVHTALMQALGCGPEDVHVLQDVTGGGCKLCTRIRVTASTCLGRTMKEVC